MVKHFRELRVYRNAFDELDPFYEHISGGLVHMMDRADQWCISSSQVREDEVEYEVSEGLTYPHTHTLTHSHTWGRTASPLQILDGGSIKPKTGAQFLTVRGFYRGDIYDA